MLADAAKHEEVVLYSLSDYVYFTDGSYTVRRPLSATDTHLAPPQRTRCALCVRLWAFGQVEELSAMEQAILNSMDFNMIFPTRYVRRFRSDRSLWWPCACNHCSSLIAVAQLANVLPAVRSALAAVMTD